MRVTQPREGEPIRLVTTSSGHRYRVVLDVAPTGSKRRQVTRTFHTLKQARDFVTTTRAGITTGAYTPPSAETLNQLSARWVTTLRDLRPVTIEGYRFQLAPVLRHLGTRRVQSLTITDVEALTDWMSREGGARGQGLSPRTVKAGLVALGQVLDMAAREGTVTRNVARLARRPRVRNLRGTDLQHWQPDELIHFADHARESGDRLAAAWLLTACGLTRADVMGLRWSDVNLHTGSVSVSQGRVALDDPANRDWVDEPKSATRRRSVPVEEIWSGTVDALRALRTSQASHPLLGLGYVERGLVVTDEAGKPLRPETYSDRFRVLSSEAGLRPINLHSVRHSLAFYLHHLGVAPADAAGLLGHTVEVHLSTYLPHSGTSGIEAAARALGQANRRAAAGS